ncbi:MAG: phenylalanine--tRNA ligase subunit beta [Planctomycetes bacterium]|nr:phenylalanine--tRNA ligase subunit beta [Planctomycetota bacterium]
MDTSVAWINDYLDHPADADEQAELLTHAGFPLEGREDLDGDIRQDFEMTSNRGDCTCHVGLAREVAALTERTLLIPAETPPTSGPTAETFATIVNEVPDSCPHYTGRVITGISVAPSNEHITSRLTARGDIPRSNVVDATNFVLFELGQPTHVFDLDTLEGGTIIIRMARKGEKFLPIGEGAEEIELDGSELVIADAEKPVALAGVKGGALTAVTDATKNILIEAATFDPVMVRHTSRLHNISSDSSFRFERGVSAGQVDAAAERLCNVILETAGGTLAPGVLASGAEMPERIVATMRTDRCRSTLGLPIDDETQMTMLDGLGFEPTIKEGIITATVPWHRGDIHREIDLIEEVMRMHGFADVPFERFLSIEPVSDPADHLAREAMTKALVADGFVESVTHSLVSESDAAAFVPKGGSARRVIEARAAGEPMLRPSVIPSLLRVRARNADRGVHSLRLFELGSVFHSDSAGAHHESIELGILMDVEDDTGGIRAIRGVVDHVAGALAADNATVEPCDDLSWLAPAGRVSIGGNSIGYVGMLTAAIAKSFGLDQSCMAAILQPGDLMNQEPAEHQITRLPDHPAIERDLSVIVADSVTWAALMKTVGDASMPLHESTGYVTTYRGKGINAGHKSVTMRLCFRAPDRTMTRDEVEGPIAGLVASLQSQVGAEVRS